MNKRRGLPCWRGLAAAGVLLTAGGAAAQQRNDVLIVYNSNPAHITASQDVANYYKLQRNIGTNLCAVNVAGNASVDLATFNTAIKAPVQACLNAVQGGATAISYIVMTYGVPFRVDDAAGTWAVDSIVSDVFDKYSKNLYTSPQAPHGYYADSQTQGQVFDPFVTLAAWRTAPKSTLIYSVWRLDGPTAAIAKGLVDKALAAEANGLTGGACIDQQISTSGLPDYLVFTGDWDLSGAAAALSQVGIAVTQDTHTAEFGTAPAPLVCPASGAASFYAGWYSLIHYNDAFTWGTGAIGWHQESGGAVDIRGGNAWVPNALQRGITVTAGSVTEPYLEGLPRAAGVTRNLLEGARVGDAFLRNTRWLRWQMVYVGDPLYRPYAAAPFAPYVANTSLRLVPRYVVGGRFSVATLTIPAAAGPGGMVFTLGVSSSGLTIPATVTVPAGQKLVKFTIGAPVVTQYAPYIVTATSGATSVSNTFVAAPLLGGVSVKPSAARGGTALVGTVLLNDAAPMGGTVVQLQSDNAALVVPAQVSVAQGLTQATFPITTSAVGAPTTVTVTATNAGATVTTQVTLTQ